MICLLPFVLPYILILLCLIRNCTPSAAAISGPEATGEAFQRGTRVTPEPPPQPGSARGSSGLLSRAMASYDGERFLHLRRSRPAGGRGRISSSPLPAPSEPASGHNSGSGSVYQHFSDPRRITMNVGEALTPGQALGVHPSLRPPHRRPCRAGCGGQLAG